MEMKNTFCPENGLTLKGHGHNFGGGGGGDYLNDLLTI